MLVPKSWLVRECVQQERQCSQQPNRQIAMNLRLQLDLDIEVDFQSQAELLAFAPVLFFVFAAFLSCHIVMSAFVASKHSGREFVGVKN